MIKNKGLLKYVTLFTLSFCYASIYALVYLKYVLYNPMLDAFNITKGQLGLFMSAYALLCMILYIPGGLIADKFSTKKILIFSLLGHGALSIFLSFSMNYVTALIVWLLFGITSAFAFWAALVKAVVSLTNEKNSGTIMGLYALGGALFTAIINAVLVKVYGSFESPQMGMSRVILITGIFTIVCALLVLLLYKDGEKREEDEGQKFNKNYVPVLLKSPILWSISLIIFCVYGLRVAGNTFFNPYLVEVKGIDLSQVAYLGIIRSNILPLLTPVAGYLADRVFKSTSKLLTVFFVILAALFMLVIFMSAGAPLWIVIAISLIPGALSGMSYGIVFSVLRETKIPDYMMGTVIGISSIIGYTPDFIFDPVFGAILDKMGNSGYNVLFVILTVIAVVGIWSCRYVVGYKKKLNDGTIKQIGC